MSRPAHERHTFFAPSGVDRDDAREWAERELSKEQYAPSEATGFDRLVLAVQDALLALIDPSGQGGAGALWWTLSIVGAAGIIVAAVLASNRLSPRGRLRPRDTRVFDDDRRSAAELRAAADTAEQSARLNDATILRFRAMARSMVERDLIAEAPGLTAQTVADHVSRAFAAHTEDIRMAATAFEGVRYLSREGDEPTVRHLRQLDDTLARTPPTSIHRSEIVATNPLERPPLRPDRVEGLQ